MELLLLNIIIHLNNDGPLYLRVVYNEKYIPKIQNAVSATEECDGMLGDPDRTCVIVVDWRIPGYV